MIDRTYVKAKKYNSLYFRLILTIIIGLATAVSVYLGIRLTANHVINTRYLSAEARTERLEAHAGNLQAYASENYISSSDTDKIAYWAKQNPYVYLLVYKDDVLFYYTDMENEEKEEEKKEEEEDEDDGAEEEGGTESPDTDSQPTDTPTDGEDKTENKNETEKNESNKTENKNEGGLGSLGLGTKVDRETLIKQAKENNKHPIELSDGTIIAEIADFSEVFYFNVVNILSLIFAAIVLTVMLVLYLRRIISRIKRLESDVNIVSHVNMNHSIVCKGKDEISMLSRNVENMRNTILENLEKERAARAANTELVTAMSHDIRTPLTVLMGYIDMLKGCEGCDEVTKSYIGATEKTAMRLKELSDDMFKYSLAFGSTDEQIAMESYDAAMLMDQLFYEHILLLKEKGYTVNYGYDSDIEEGTTVYTDPQNLMRIIDNVFQNICKYAKKDEPVDFTVSKDKDYISFIVRNKLSDEPVTAESNGIGLKTCKRLAQYIAEDFSYENDGEYFTVILTLKLARPDKQKNK